MTLRPVSSTDIPDLVGFLERMDLTVAGLDTPGLRVWVRRDTAGAIVASTGYELSADGRDALIRSVAVDPARRSAGEGSDLARFALSRAATEGARTAWLFSRRSGPFWLGLGFEPADRDELARVLGETEQVRLFVASGQLAREVAWSRSLRADTSGNAERPGP